MAIIKEHIRKLAYYNRFDNIAYEEALDHSKIESLLNSLERYSNKLDKLLTRTSNIEEQISPIDKGKYRND